MASSTIRLEFRPVISAANLARACGVGFVVGCATGAGFALAVLALAT